MLKKDHTDASVYQQLFMEIQDRYRDYIPGYRDGSQDGNFVLKSGQSLKAWKKLKILFHPNTLFLQTHFRVSNRYNL